MVASRLIWSALVGLAVFCVPALGDTWVKFREPANTFTVELPLAPFVTTEDDGATINYKVNSGELQFQISVVTHARKLGSDAMDNSIAGTADAGYTLKDKKSIVLDGHEGRAAVFTDSDGSEFREKIFRVDRLFYQVIAVLPTNATPAQRTEVERVMNSFHFTN